ncbi:hypothetical protein JD844_031011 [Phrynosoma platyrhinos]|uniref:Uncharacterized protein n=1 Tax=Phrynosoma platyrhinos TaxID=52577 RepID=A0ABQ7T042_PHRPL|nr:hypothetical protein JD844_031011 [Phrynosoma platyrhinos]
MNALFCLSVICAALAVCHGSCFMEKHEAVIKNGQLVVPKMCVDKYDGSKHPIGKRWNTADCMECDCDATGMQCCTRYSGLAHIEGCTGKVDKKTCQYKYFKADDPSKPCF